MPQKLLADWIRLKGSAFQRKLSKYEVTIATAKWLKTPGSFLLQLQYIQDSKLAQPIRVKFVSPSRFKDDTFDQRPSFRGKYVVFYIIMVLLTSILTPIVAKAVYTKEGGPRIRSKLCAYVSTSLTRRKMPVNSGHATIAAWSFEIFLDLVISRKKSNVVVHHRSLFNLTKWGYCIKM